MQSDDRPNEEPNDGVRDAEEERMIRIMQYCDGVLPAREAALVADEIARDPEAARLAAEMSAGADAAQAALGKFDQGPVPFELARRVTQSARTPVRGTRVAGGADWRIAASLVVGAALGMLGLLVAQQGEDQGLRLAGTDRIQSEVQVSQAWQPALMNALAKDPETASVNFKGDSGGESAIRIARWFNTEAGLRCAEFAHSTSGTVTAGGIACRKPDGGWDVIEQPR